MPFETKFQSLVPQIVQYAAKVWMVRLSCGQAGRGRIKDADQIQNGPIRFLSDRRKTPMMTSPGRHPTLLFFVDAGVGSGKPYFVSLIGIPALP